MGNDLESKVVLLTGGASGIGRGCALAYARDGAVVAILDRNFEEAEATAKELGNRSGAYHADASNGAEPNPAGIRKYLDDIHLLGLCPQGDVFADAAVFLLSAKARFITGCILPVSGGAELGYRR
jgi:NAD(P)-dependent dehydrogenase (short-subunit alcohol dehydrogenase family)